MELLEILRTNIQVIDNKGSDTDKMKKEGSLGPSPKKNFAPNLAKPEQYTRWRQVVYNRP